MPTEAYLQRRARHRHVIDLYEVFLTEDHYVYVMERPERCIDLFDILQGDGILTEKQARRYFFQIVEANLHCERRGVLHRDLKPENILVDLTTHEAKLIDFGLASEVQEKPFKKFRGERDSSNRAFMSRSTQNYKTEKRRKDRHFGKWFQSNSTRRMLCSVALQRMV